MLRRRALATCLAAHLFMGAAAAQPPPQDLLQAAFHERARRLAADLDGLLGVTFLDLTTGDTFAINGDVVFTQASAIKVPILVELFRQAAEGRFSLDDPLPLKPSDVTPGSGVLQRLTAGRVTMTIRDVATLMVIVSDNTATNMIIDLVGMERVSETVRRLGLSHTVLRRKMMDADAWEEGRENVSTPNEAARLLELIYKAGVLDRAGCDEVLRILSIPKGSQIRTLLPRGVRVAHKTGSLSGVVVDIGIVYAGSRPFVIAAMANWLLDPAEAQDTIARLARLGYDYFDRLARSNAYGHRR